MIRLELTTQQAHTLQPWLASALQRPIGPDYPTPLHTILDRLTLALAAARQQTSCPVCDQPCSPLNVGRSARYCLPACKQKAGARLGAPTAQCLAPTVRPALD